MSTKTRRLPECPDSELHLVAPAMMAFVKVYIGVPGFEALRWTVRFMIELLNQDDPHLPSVLECLVIGAEDLGIRNSAIMNGLESNEDLLEDLQKCWEHDKEKCMKYSWNVDTNFWPGADEELAKYID